MTLHVDVDAVRWPTNPDGSPVKGGGAVTVLVAEGNTGTERITFGGERNQMEGLAALLVAQGGAPVMVEVEDWAVLDRHVLTDDEREAIQALAGRL